MFFSLFSFSFSSLNWKGLINQSDNFPHIPGNVTCLEHTGLTTWSNSQRSLSFFHFVFFSRRVRVTQATQLITPRCPAKIPYLPVTLPLTCLIFCFSLYSSRFLCLICTLSPASFPLKYVSLISHKAQCLVKLTIRRGQINFGIAFSSVGCEEKGLYCADFW